MSYSVSKVKTFLGREGHGYNCELLRDGVVVASIRNMADGGDISIDWKDRSRRVPVTVRNCGDGKLATYSALPEEALLLEFCRDKDRMFDGTRFDLSPDIYVGELVGGFLTEKEMRARCKKNTCFRLKDDAPDSYRTFHVPYSKDVRDLIKGRHGDKVEVIYNESLYGGAG